MTLSQEEYAGLTLEEAAAGVREKRFTAAELLEAGLERVTRFEPAVNALLTLNGEAARRRAAEIDAEPNPPANAPLWGVPVTLKDNLMTRGLRTTCASRILENFVPPYDAAVVEKFRAAGAVVLAKTNMDEFAMGSSGENSAYGPTRNPWDPSRVTGGSSSGGAASVAYGAAPVSLASDTGGSIRQPASFCGVVGVKPTYGRVSRRGVASLASSLDQVGPFTRSVRDNALALDVISGHDPLDSTSSRVRAEPCLPAVENGVKGLRIGYDPSILESGGFAKSHAEALRRAVAIVREAGAESREIAIPLLKYGVAAYYIICACEASANLARFDGVRYGVRREGKDLWDVYSGTRGTGFGDEVKRRIMMGAYALSKGYYDAYYLRAARVRRLFTLEFGKLFGDVDAILMPVAPTPPKRVGQASTVLESYLGDIFTLPANLTSLPAVAFPLGVADGLPVGAQVLAAPFREDLAYRVARVVEKAIAMPGAPWTRPNPETAK